MLVWDVQVILCEQSQESKFCPTGLGSTGGRRMMLKAGVDKQSLQDQPSVLIKILKILNGNQEEKLD